MRFSQQEKYEIIQLVDASDLSAADEFTGKTHRVNEMWQTDFTYFKIIDWGWYYLSTILDDYSRYILSLDLSRRMTSGDVIPSVE